MINEPSIPEIARRLSEWAAPNSPKGENKEYLELARHVYSCFSGAQGEIVLNLILNMSLRRGFKGEDADMFQRWQGAKELALALMRYYQDGKDYVDGKREYERSRSAEPSERDAGSFTDSFGAIR